VRGEQASVILGLRRRGHTPYEIAAALSVPVSVVEGTLRTAGHRMCDATGKRCHSSERAAKAATRTAHNKIRVYRCPECNLFHVTSEAEGWGKGKHR
jgi:hypothetical protein